MFLNEAMQWLRWHGESVGRLAMNGDDFAKEVIRAYQDLYKDQLNPIKQNLVISRVTEMAKRTLTETDLTDLQNRYGYKIDEKLE